MEAKARGATVIHVDPHFTRTSALADMLRPDPRRHRHRLPRRDHQPRPRRTSRTSASTSLAYTNAPTIVGEEFQDTEDLDGAVLRARPRRRGTTTRRAGSTRASTSRPPRRRSATRSGRPADRRREAGHGESHGSGGPRVGAATPRRDETLQHPRCVCQILKRHYARYTPEMVRARSAASRPSCSRRSASCSSPTPAASAPRRSCYARRLDAAHDRLAVHPRRVDPAAAAGQHRPARRRGDGDARPRLHPGLQRHPDAVRPAARATSRCRTRTRTRTSTSSSRPTRPSEGFWGNMRDYTGQPAQGVVGRRGDRRQRLLLRLPAAADRQPQHLRHRAWRRSTGTCKGYFLFGENPAVGSANARMQRLGHGQARLARGARLLADRVARRGGRTAPRSRPARCAPRTSRPRCSSSRPRRTPRRTARSPTPSGCCSGTTRRSSRAATRAATCGSSTTSAGASASGWPARPTRWTGRCST